MTDWFDGYHDLLSEQSEQTQSYAIGSPNWLAGRTLLISVESIKQAIDYAGIQAGDYTTDKERLQYLLSRKSVHHLEACFILIQNQLYNPSRSQIRFLFELYLLLRGLNRNKEQAAKIYQDTVTQLRDIGEEPFTGTRLATINPFHDIITSERDKIGDLEYDVLWLHTSNAAVHPYSIESAELDNEYDEDLERTLLNIANALAFGIAAKLIKTWEETPMYRKLFEQLDPMIVRIRLASIGALPRLFNEDLDLWFADPSWRLRASSKLK
jgi:hypothetical protein